MLVQASVVVAIEAAAQLSDSTHIMLYSIRWEYRDTPGGPDDRRIILYARCSSSLCQQSGTENGWLERQCTTGGMGGSCFSGSSDVWLDTPSQYPNDTTLTADGWTRDHNDSVADAVSYLSHQSVTFFISHAHTISLLLYHLSFIPDPSVIPPIITYHHW